MRKFFRSVIKMNKRQLSKLKRECIQKRWEKQQIMREKMKKANDARMKKKAEQREKGVEQNRSDEDATDEEVATAPSSSHTSVTTRHECRQRIQRAEQELHEVRRQLAAEREQRQQQAIQHQNEMAQAQQQQKQQKQELEQAQQQLQQQKQELEHARQQLQQQKQELEHARQQLHQHQYATQALQQRNGVLMRQNEELFRTNDELQQRRVRVQPPPPTNDENVDPKRGRPTKSFAEMAGSSRRAEISQTVKTVLGSKNFFKPGAPPLPIGTFHLCAIAFAIVTLGQRKSRENLQNQARELVLGSLDSPESVDVSAQQTQNRNILRDDGPAHVTTFLPPSPQRDRIRLALELLAHLQSFAAAERLDNERIIHFRTTADQFRQHMQQHFADHCTTPKFHHLVHHAPNFAAEHGFWGLLSEQPMERFHADFNNALARKASTKDMYDILMFCTRESLLRNAIFDAGEM